MPFLPPNQQRQSTEDTVQTTNQSTKTNNQILVYQAKPKKNTADIPEISNISMVTKTQSL